MTHAIIFDTNTLYLKNKDFSTFSVNNRVLDLKGKIELRDAVDEFQILIPEVSIEELFMQQLREYEHSKNELQEKYSSFRNVGEISLNINEFEYSTFLESRKNTFLMDNHILIIPICNENRFKDIVARALRKEPPFEGKDKQSDKGFKDVLIWESILEYSKNNQFAIHFVTNDKGFKQTLIEEFKSRVGREINIYKADELSSLHDLISSYSDDKAIAERKKTASFALKRNIDGIKNFFIGNFNTEIKVNEIQMNIKNIVIEDEFIDLIEINEELFKCYFKGKIELKNDDMQMSLKIKIPIEIELAALKLEEILSIKFREIEFYSSNSELEVQYQLDAHVINFEEEEKEEEEEEEEVAVVEAKEEVAVVEAKEEVAVVEAKEEVAVVEAKEEEEVKELRKLRGILHSDEQFNRLISNFKIDKENFIDLIISNWEYSWHNFSFKEAKIKKILKIYLFENEGEKIEIDELMDVLVSISEKIDEGVGELV